MSGRSTGRVAEQPSRRSAGPRQQQKSSETRRKVIQAAIGCIAESGVKRATAMRIAERAGVSWGAIQHQFGDKAAILDAVLQQVLGEFSSTLAGVSPARDSLKARLD